MRAIPALTVSLLLAGCGTEPPRQALVWEPVDIPLEALQQRPWHEFPARAVFTHESGETIELEAFWTAEKQYAVRFSAPKPGSWSFVTHSDDPALDGVSGVVEASQPDPGRLDVNPNLRGSIHIASNQRTFQYDDGTPFFLLADTLWAGNTARAGLGDNEDGPFFQYLADRKRKSFSAVLMQLFHGFGDYPEDPDGHANEGGHLFLDRDFDRLNPDFLRATDARWQALWERGWVVASPYSWWGKTKTCRFDPEQAQRLAAYLAVRYGAFTNSIWAVSGEYQYVFRDCGWTEADLNAVAEAIQAHNPYRRPLSIHPSGQTRWEDGHGVQSSRPFNDQPWLDHHWLQTGQSLDRVYNIALRAAENRTLQPSRPVFCSEAFYERDDDPDAAYHARWQAWSAFLNGCAGYGYGAQGMWQFYDSDHPSGEPGKDTGFQVDWEEALAFAGSGQVGHVRTVLSELDWPSLEPRPDAVLLDGRPAPPPSPDDITPPQAAEIPGEAWILYLPRGNGGKAISLHGLDPGAWNRTWIDPRTGEPSDAGRAETSSDPLPVPERPDPSQDWTLLLTR